MLKELHLASISELTPRKRKLYKHIWNRESALCKLKKKYDGKKMEQLCDVDSDPLKENLSSSLSLEAVRLLAGISRNSRQKPKGRRWNFDYKLLALSLLNVSPKSYILLHTLLPLPSRRSLQSALLFHSGQASMLMSALSVENV